MSWSAANRFRRCRSGSGATSGGERYHAAYFERFPEVWAHGDFASWTVHGGMVIHGRSDATLNPGGVRIGTAEIYRVVESMPEVLEALAFGQQLAGRRPDRAARSSRRRRDAHRRPRRRRSARASAPSARPATSLRLSPRSTTFPARAATSSSSSRSPMPCTGGRSATPRRSRIPEAIDAIVALPELAS